MDFSKAFDTLYHALLIAKLQACGFYCLSLEIINNCLINRDRGCKIGNCFSV